ncbi:MAG: sll1863 family stress response protein [Bacteroidia bacterium]
MNETKQKRTLVTVGIAYVMAACALLACNSPEEKVEKAKEDVREEKADVTKAEQNLNKAEEDYNLEIEDYRRQTAEEYEANQKSINEFNERISKQKKEARDEYKAKIAELNRKNADMKKRMDDYKANGKEDWQSFKREFRHDMDELRQSLKDLGKDNVK